MIIGRDGNQPFPINDPKVSSRHAILNIGDDGRMWLIDNSSTNGTYIYDGVKFARLYPNKSYAVNPDTMIRLGFDTQFHIRRILPTPVHPLPDKRLGAAPQKKKVDISTLKKVSDRYTRNKIALESKSSFINGLRSFSIIITMVAGTGGTYITNHLATTEQGKELGSILCIGIALILMLILILLTTQYNKKLIQKKIDNERDYAVKYVCPECHVSFRNKVYENILAERSCPKCKTEFYEKTT